MGTALDFTPTTTCHGAEKWHGMLDWLIYIALQRAVRVCDQVWEMMANEKGPFQNRSEVVRKAVYEVVKGWLLVKKEQEHKWGAGRIWLARKMGDFKWAQEFGCDEKLLDPEKGFLALMKKHLESRLEMVQKIFHPVEK